MIEALSILVGIAHVVALGGIIGIINTKAIDYLVAEGTLPREFAERIGSYLVIFRKLKLLYLLLFIALLAVIDILFHEYLFELAT